MSNTPRTDKWIERYNLMRGTGLEALPMNLEYELTAKDAIISDMGKRFDKLAAERDAMTIRAERAEKMVEVARGCLNTLAVETAPYRNTTCREVMTALDDMDAIAKGKK